MKFTKNEQEPVIPPPTITIELSLKEARFLAGAHGATGTCGNESDFDDYNFYSELDDISGADHSHPDYKAGKAWMKFQRSE